MSSLKLQVDSNNSILKSSYFAKPQRTLVQLLTNYSELIGQQEILEQRIIEAVKDWAGKNQDLMSCISNMFNMFEDRKQKLESFRLALSDRLAVSNSNFDALAEKLKAAVDSQSKTAKKIDHYYEKLRKLVKNNKKKVALGRKLSDDECNVMDRNERKLESFEFQLVKEENLINQLRKDMLNEQLQGIVPALSTYLETVIGGKNHQETLSSLVRLHFNKRPSVYSIPSLCKEQSLDDASLRKDDE